MNARVEAAAAVRQTLQRNNNGGNKSGSRIIVMEGLKPRTPNEIKMASII